MGVGAATQGYRNWEIFAALELMALPEERKTIR